MSLSLSLAGLWMVLSSWLHYLWLIPREWVPERPLGHQAILVGGAAIAGIGVAVGWGDDLLSTALAVVIFGGCVGGAAFFFWLLSWGPLPDQAIAVSVGDELPELGGRDHTGANRSLEEWRGKRVLLKFFRGHW